MHYYPEIHSQYLPFYLPMFSGNLRRDSVEIQNFKKPPQGFSSPPVHMLVDVSSPHDSDPPSSHEDIIAPRTAEKKKRLLSSPEEVQKAFRRRLVAKFNVFNVFSAILTLSRKLDAFPRIRRFSASETIFPRQ